MDITQQEQLDDALRSIDWHHAFIRELHLVSPSYYVPEKRHTVAPDSKPDVFVLICTNDSSCRHVELVFRETKRLVVPCNLDLNPSGRVERDSVEFRFSPTDDAVLARSVAVKRLGDEGAGWELRYGMINPFSESGLRDE